MDMTTVYIWGSIGAAFCLLVGALIGHCCKEREFAETIRFVSDTHKEWVAETKAEMIESLRKSTEADAAVIRELEISLLLSGQAIESIANDLQKAEERLAYVDKYRKAIVEDLVQAGLWDLAKHGADPVKMLNVMYEALETKLLDPTVNQKAKNLYVKGVRAGAKKGREQMRKLMQKSIDNQAATITRLSDGYNAQVFTRQNLMDTLAAAHMREDIYREAVSNTLTDKIALPSVRRAIVKGIAVECTRLRAVETNKGV